MAHKLLFTNVPIRDAKQWTGMSRRPGHFRPAGIKVTEGRARFAKPRGAQRPRILPKEARAAALQPDLQDEPKQ